MPGSLEAQADAACGGVLVAALGSRKDWRALRWGNAAKDAGAFGAFVGSLLADGHLRVHGASGIDGAHLGGQ